jgi:hypothetical protein
LVATRAHCLELKREADDVRQQLARAGRNAGKPQSIADNDLEREPARWLDSNRQADAAAGFRAGWARLSKLAGPRIRDWEALWWKASREQDSLRSRIGVLLREISRLTDSG